MRIKKFSPLSPQRRTPEQIEQVIREYHDSGLTQADYAARPGVALSTLARWLRAVRNRRGPSAASQADFVEIEVPSTRPAPGSGVYQIELPGGVRLRAEGAWQGEQLRELIGILQGL